MAIINTHTAEENIFWYLTNWKQFFSLPELLHTSAELAQTSNLEDHQQEPAK